MDTSKPVYYQRNRPLRHRRGLSGEIFRQGPSYWISNRRSSGKASGVYFDPSQSRTIQRLSIQLRYQYQKPERTGLGTGAQICRDAPAHHCPRQRLGPIHQPFRPARIRKPPSMHRALRPTPPCDANRIPYRRNLHIHYRRTLCLRSLHDGQEHGNLQLRSERLAFHPVGTLRVRQEQRPLLLGTGFCHGHVLRHEFPSGVISMLSPSQKVRWSARRLLPSCLRRVCANRIKLIDRDLIPFIRKGQESNGSVRGVIDAMRKLDRIAWTIRFDPKSSNVKSGPPFRIRIFFFSISII